VSELTPEGVSLTPAQRESPPPEALRAANEQVARLMARYPDVVLGLCYVNPLFPEDSLAEMERWLGQGGFAGLKLWVAARAHQPAVADLVAWCAARDIPICQHVWEKATGNLTGESTSEDFQTLAKRFPHAPLIMYHTGGDFERGVRAVRHLDHVFCEIGGSDAVDGALERVVNMVGADRVLFGSDQPGRSIASQLSKVLGARISDADKEKILFKNAERLFGTALRRAAEAEGAAATIRTVSPPRAILDAALAGAPTDLEDVNCYAGSWPFRPLPTAGEDVAPLRQRLAGLGVTRAWVSPLVNFWRADPMPANRWLHAQLEGSAGGTRLAPCYTINPAHLDWEPDLAACREQLGLAPGTGGVRLCPTYHGYALDGPLGTAVLRACAGAGLPVFVTAIFEDTRTQHPRAIVPDLAPAEIVRALQAVPEARVVVTGLNYPAATAVLRDAPHPEHVLVDVSRVQGALDGVGKLAEANAGRVAFGTNLPLVEPVSPLLSLHVAGMADADRARIARANARRFLAGT
jgi:predicted TIM-barrel fold metal-dependent hydrolase